MDYSTLCWSVLIFALCITTFGLLWCLTAFTSLIFFLLGVLSFLYIKGGTEPCFTNCSDSSFSNDLHKGGIKKILDLMEVPEKVPKTDKRITGSEIIDNLLQEIFGYIIRDYVLPWYSLISLDKEFPEVTLRTSAQALAVNISNRAKEVDWIPYLTTRLVDDAATHLRLFKQAKFKLEQHKIKSQRNSPARDRKYASKQIIHKRNKSEADVTTYSKNTERNVGGAKFYIPDQSNNTLEDYFFELECQMENNTICRDLVCMNVNEEKDFITDLIELLLYILLPDDDFNCKPVRFLFKEILANCVVLPIFNSISDPDFVNQSIIWLCVRENTLPSDIFLLTLRLTDNCDELRYTKELVIRESQVLRSRDSGGEGDIAIKQQLSSLTYVNKLIDNRLFKLESLQTSETNNTIDNTKLENVKRIKLPLDVILKNNIALSYFIDFVTSGGVQAYLFFYLNIEGWKVSVEQQLSALHINKIKNVNEKESQIYDTIRNAALSLFDQYLGDRSEHKIQIKPSLVQTLYFKIRNVNEIPSEQWFDDIQSIIHEKLKQQDEFLPAFQESNAYLKLLEELDLVQQNQEEDTISISSLENTESSGEESKNKSLPDSENNTKLTISNNFLTVDGNQKITKHVRSLSDITDLSGKEESFNVSQSSTHSSQTSSDKTSQLQEGRKEENLKVGDFTLSVIIIETGIVCEKGKTFGVYALQVSRQFENGYQEEWHIYRRYSDFYDLHTKVKDKYHDLSKVPFPGKKTFHNMDRSVLEKRMRMLGQYLQHLCQSHILSFRIGLRDLLMTFLEQGDYDRATSGGPISNTIDTIVNPLKSGMKTIKNMPEQLINTVDEVVEGISKVFTSKSQKFPEASKVGASLDIESDDNIPLRIMLLLMDEVFDLKSRNQWLRRRIVTLLRQIVRTMFGDIVNRRILEYVSVMTSPKNVARYLHTFKQSFWPNGVKADPNMERDEATRFRTRVAAKIALLSWLSDELKHIIGSETTRRGLLTIFELFQRPILNRRLIYVLLEGIITHLFPDRNMNDLFRKLYSKNNLSKAANKECDTSKNS